MFRVSATLLKKRIYHYYSLVKRDHLNPLLGNNLGNKLWLFDDESGSQLDDALLHRGDAVLESHVLLEGVVEDRVHEVARVPVCALGHLLEGAEVVHPVEFRLPGAVLEATDKAVHLLGAASQGLCELGAHVLCGCLH